GREFSARHVDFNFITITTEEEARFNITDVKARATRYQRECGVMTYGMVCCRDTEKEAQELYDHIVREGDWEAANNIMDLLGIESSSFGDKDTVRRLGERFIAGWGGYPLVGTPEQVVEKMQSIHNMGIEGLILSWLDYHEELQYFGERVMPLLRQAGLRQ
ncbi:MAG: LLM class flavin-dependent oxidoreductase, partial [Gammaproteobacteria bacterium]